MSGPALKNLFSHQTIHEGYYTEGRDLTELLEKLYQEERLDDCKEVADVLVEHWETRMIAHADSEEEGFYLEVVEKEPELAEKIIMLKRDHDILRIVVAEVKEIILKDGVTAEVMDRFKTILLLVEFHSREEEKYLFAHEESHLDHLHELDNEGKTASG